MCPRWLFLYPGECLLLFGGFASALLLFADIRIGGVVFSYHSLILTAAMTNIGVQSVFFWAFASIVGTGLAIAAAQNRHAYYDDDYGYYGGPVYAPAPVYGRPVYGRPVYGGPVAVRHVGYTRVTPYGVRHVGYTRVRR